MVGYDDLEEFTMKSFFEQDDGAYTIQNDDLIPNLTIPTEPEFQLGRYALMHRAYLQQHRQVF